MVRVIQGLRSNGGDPKGCQEDEVGVRVLDQTGRVRQSVE